MFTSFSTALSALSAHSTGVDVIGNNLANLNTLGFKANVVAFSDLITQSLGDTQVGFGVARPVTIRQFTQGAIQASTGPLDTAIEGDGFLVVNDSRGAQLYSRGGNLQINKDGNLVTATGFKIQGWNEVNGVLDTTQPVRDVVIPVGTLRAPLPSKSFSFDLNLDAAATSTPPTSFSTAIEVFDSLGTPHTVTVKFNKAVNANEWAYSAAFPDADLKAAFTPVTGTITFDGDGKLLTPKATDPMPVLNVTGLADGAKDMSITWNLFNGLAPRLTQYSQPSTVAANSQDGGPAAQLIRVAIGDGGKVLAQYSNGQQVAVGQLAMAAIRNPESLLAIGNNNFQVGARTAQPTIGLPQAGGRGQILGGSVESSTVDIAREFTNLIVLQRGYQANAKVVSAVDELSRDTINLLR